MAISHTLLLQKEFWELPASTLKELEKIYNEERRKAMSDIIPGLQSRYRIDPGSGLGRTYGDYPPWTRFADALEKSRNGNQNAQKERTDPCEGCGESPSIAQCEPCGHLVCESCHDDLEQGIREDFPGRCGECNKQVDGLVDIMDEADDDDEDENGGTKSKKRPVPWWPTLPGPPMPSTKAMAVKLKVLDWLHKDKSVKIVIFTSYLGW